MDQLLKFDLDQFFNNPATLKHSLTALLESLTLQTQDPKNRDKLNLEFFQRLSLILKNTPDDAISVSTLRVLRNSAANCPQNQSLLHDAGIIRLIVDQFLEQENPPASKSLRALAIQVIANSIVGNPENCRVVLLEYRPVQWITGCLQQEEDRIRNYACMLGLTLTQSEPVLTLKKLDIPCVEALIEHPHLEFAALWLEYLIYSDGFLTSFYPLMKDELNVKLLHVMTTNFPGRAILAKELLEFFINIFKTSADRILTTTSTAIPNDFNVSEMTAVTELFCKLIHCDALKSHMQSDTSFVVSTIALLRSIHEIGTSGENSFTPIEKLQADSVDVEIQPGFLFKADLIRLLGALVEGVPANQNQVREMGVLPVILNCTKVDARNPFIPQCSVLTLQCLLAGNLENQQYISQLQKE